MREAVDLNKRGEARGFGNVTLATVREIAENCVDYIRLVR